MPKTRHLKWCNNCREYSVASKCYTRKADGQKMCVEFCLNKGCGYSNSYAIPITIYTSSGNKTISIMDTYKDHCEFGMTDDECDYVSTRCKDGYCVRRDEYDCYDPDR